MSTGSAGRAARRGMLAALALVLGYVESLFPPLAAVPGMKIGLSNLAVLSALYLDGGGAALGINFVRIALSAMLFGNGAGFVYSFSGGMLSVLVMILMKRSGRFGTAAVSAAGGISHNVGQIAAAVWLSGTSSVMWYLVVLWFSGLVSGLLVGAAGTVLVDRLRDFSGIRRASDR